MRIPKVISRNNREYIFVKAYPNHYLYQDMMTGYKECFLLQDLISIKQAEDYKKERKISKGYNDKKQKLIRQQLRCMSKE